MAWGIRGSFCSGRVTSPWSAVIGPMILGVVAFLVFGGRFAIGDCRRAAGGRGEGKAK